MISIVHPSRSRPEKAFSVFIHWTGTAHEKIEYILSIDSDDPELNQYLNLFENNQWDDVSILISDNSCCVQAVNAGAKKTTGDIIVVVSDDFKAFPNWDIKLKEAFKGDTDVVLKTDDGIQRYIVTLPILDRAYYERVGFVYHPDFRHMFADTYMTHRADAEGKLLFRPDLLFKHEHYSTKATKKDALNERNDKTWEQGEEVYLREVRNGFGAGIDIWNIRDRGMKNWLKSKGL